MLEIGQPEGNYNLDSADIKTVELIKGLARNKLYITHGGDNPLDLGVANQNRPLEEIPFKKWRVIGLGMFFMEDTVGDDLPIVEYGTFADRDSYGIMTSTVTAGAKFNRGDKLVYDPYDILSPSNVSEATATFGWIAGVSFGVWNMEELEFIVSEAAVLGLGSGKVKPYMLIEVETGGKW